MKKLYNTPQIESQEMKAHMLMLADSVTTTIGADIDYSESDPWGN